jgi:hypothetical protein
MEENFEAPIEFWEVSFGLRVSGEQPKSGFSKIMAAKNRDDLKRLINDSIPISAV